MQIFSKLSIYQPARINLESFTEITFQRVLKSNQNIYFAAESKIYQQQVGLTLLPVRITKAHRGKNFV